MIYFDSDRKERSAVTWSRALRSLGEHPDR